MLVSIDGVQFSYKRRMDAMEDDVADPVHPADL